MFYPKCPQCGSKTESAESGTFDKGISIARQRLLQERLAGHPHPAMQTMGMIALLAREAYKRAPGCGEKRCTSCGHHFR